ncbi:hypothetical protein CVT25_008985 [Psilocybe cyanescens]|uniref:Uncharacterized protein n=1 Tax=Psilocybe cyanescens TaxID=93625 RepID=A0A409XNC8_PSICY|nr:hypothetical protein CVT25_008985 [Psilocybe cyanescens]
MSATSGTSAFGGRSSLLAVMASINTGNLFLRRSQSAQPLVFIPAVETCDRRGAAPGLQDLRYGAVIVELSESSIMFAKELTSFCNNLQAGLFDTAYTLNCFARIGESAEFVLPAQGSDVIKDAVKDLAYRKSRYQDQQLTVTL